MSVLKWDEVGKRYFKLGVRKTVVYPQAANGTYPLGIAWSGITGIDENPEGAEPNDLYADDIKYGTIRSAEKYGVNISAYDYPKEFMPCDGVVEVAPGVYIAQQTRQAFGLSWRTAIGNDISAESDDSYELHLAWGLTVSPSDKTHDTINDNPDAEELSFDAEGLPVECTGHKPVYSMVIDSRYTPPAVLAAIEDALYGTVSSDPYLPTPDQIIAMTSTAGAELTALTIGSNVLHPTFDASVLSYEVATSNAADAVTATGESEATVAIAVNSASHTSGEDATWVTGRNIVTVTVSKSGKLNTTYTVIVNKSAA